LISILQVFLSVASFFKRRVKPGQSEESIAKKPRNDPGSSDNYVITNGSSVRGMWESSAGMIIRVLMKNFMCHGQLDYRPTERLNFLHGVNGSGKSAVLSAIVFALGATARMSNRGTSNKSFVRSGQASASVEISLSNEGEDAYRPDIYGNIITIVRTISTSGASTYKIKDHRGRIMCDKKVREELDRITEAFSIQVDNPIAILNQDAAKTFLFKCDPSKLYEFFMRATQLEDCKRDYNVAAEEKNVSEAHIKDKEDSIHFSLQLPRYNPFCNLPTGSPS
jgi:chromosome segregation ATPase